MSDGAHFGEIAFLVADQRRITSVIALEVCEVYLLNRKDFHQCIAIHSELLAEIEHIAKKRIEQTIEIEEQHKSLLMRSNREQNSR